MKQEKGITIIALIITVIVMIILVGVSIDFAIDKGLSETAKKTGQDTEDEVDYEKMIAQGYVLNSKNEWVKLSSLGGTSGGSSSGGNTSSNVTLAEGWSVATTTPTGWSNTVKAVTDGTNTIPIPSGFNMSQEEGESSYSEGVVIIDDNDNEFVWVSYTGEYVEKTLINSADQTAIENTINKYGGFWIGRYNTTYSSYGDDYENIGVKSTGSTLGLYYSYELNPYYETTGGEFFNSISGTNTWQDFYSLQNNAVGNSKMVTYQQCELASSVANVEDLSSIWTLTSASNDKEHSYIYDGTSSTYNINANIRDIWDNGFEARMALILS